MSSSNFISMALQRYPVNDSMYPEQRARNLRLREEYVRALEECKVSPAYHIQLPSGDMHPCKCEPFMEDDTKGWTTVKRRVRVKREISDEELEYLASLPNRDYWETGSVDSHSYQLTGGEHNGALFDIGARF